MVDFLKIFSVFLLMLFTSLFFPLLSGRCFNLIFNSSQLFHINIYSYIFSELFFSDFSPNILFIIDTIFPGNLLNILIRVALFKFSFISWIISVSSRVLFDIHPSLFCVANFPKLSGYHELTIDI